MPQAKKPLITEDLIVYLEELFPDKCADLKEDERVIFYKCEFRKKLNN